MRSKMLVLMGLFCLFSVTLVLDGCKSLNATDPADTGKPALQFLVATGQASTQPSVQAGATVVGAATGQPWIPMVVEGVGALAVLLAGIFGSKYAGAQAHLNVAQAAAGVTDNAKAIASLVSTGPNVAKYEAQLGNAAGAIAAAAPIVGMMVPRTQPIAGEVGQVAAAVQQSLSTPPVSVTVNQSPPDSKA